MYHMLAAIIAVAIGVFMSAAGTIYTGSAFSGASSKAVAMQIISGMEQIDAAWSMWEANGGNIKTAGAAAVVKAALTASGTYLSQYPSPPAYYPGTGGAAYGGGFTVTSYNIDIYTDNVPTLTTAVTGNAVESQSVGTYFFLDKTIGASTCLAIAQSAGLIAQGSNLTTANLTLSSGYVLNLLTNSGLASVADVNGLNANYKYWCAPMTAAFTAAGLRLGNTAVTAGAGNDDSTYLVYFKHQ